MTKIDYVIPYVDGSDENWLKLYAENKYMNENAGDLLEVSKRFAPNRLFKYQLRGIEKFMPWIGTVHLIVQQESQIPDWINRDSVHIVYHEDYIPREYLPTFNSSSMECFLHRIPDLAVRFIYANDDTYVMNATEPSDFFEGVMPLNSFDVRKVHPVNNESFSRMNVKITDFICEELGYPHEPWTMFLPDHVQKAMNKAVLKNIYDEYEDYIKSRVTKFRTDDNLSQAFFTMYYMVSTGFRYEKRISAKRFDFYQDFGRIIKFFDETDPVDYPKLLCINNNDNDRDIAVMCKFEELFPEKSVYEN